MLAMDGTLEWSDLRYFLELAREGTLSGASRRLCVEHTTVARRLSRLTTQFGLPLFDRRRDGYELTQQGKSLLVHAEAMESAALAASAQVRHGEGAVQGVVRLSVPDEFAGRGMTLPLARLLLANPELDIEMLITSRSIEFSNGESDLMIALDPPVSDRYVVEKLAQLRFSLYASQAYLARRPPIRNRSDLVHHDFVDYVQDDRSGDTRNYLDELGFTPRRRLCCTDMESLVETALYGFGLILAPAFAIPADGSLISVCNEFFVDRTLWLAALTKRYQLQRVQLVWKLLQEHMELSLSV
jgi:DNA-binding transcriptional LysR family regulator